MAFNDFCDGPYLLDRDSGMMAYWIDQGEIQSMPLENLKEDDIDIKVNRVFNPKLLFPGDFEIDKTFEVSTDSSVIAISDIHGHFDTATALFKAHDIIDESYNWNFGDGHLVVLGDVFDRGDQVLECLWLIHNLQIQAAIVGGKVHFLLGNHDLMVLSNDLRYIDDRYWKTSGLMELRYDELFSKKTYLGRWLRSCPVMLKINNYLFVHAGTSYDLVHHDLSIAEINHRFQSQIFQSTEVSDHDIEINNLLLNERGPIWHRGFFDGSMDSFLIDKITKFYNVDHIVVGHTRQPSISLRFDGKVIAIDASIQTGADGELLWANIDRPSRGLISGELVQIH